MTNPMEHQSPTHECPDVSDAKRVRIPPYVKEIGSRVPAALPVDPVYGITDPTDSLTSDARR